ncbi:MAG: SgcJ/EcaC family oxidoreductase [Myxococcota bacterium]
MTSSHDEQGVRSLFFEIHRQWNERNAQTFADLFSDDGSMVGFDGSSLNGRADIASHLAGIFGHHQTAAFVGRVREVRLLAPDVALVRAVAGMVPPGGSDINPAVNAIQSVTAVRQGGRWRVAMFQNTPAAFHGRPEESARLTDELREVLKSR